MLRWSYKVHIYCLYKPLQDLGVILLAVVLVVINIAKATSNQHSPSGPRSTRPPNAFYRADETECARARAEPCRVDHPARQTAGVAAAALPPADKGQLISARCFVRRKLRNSEEGTWSRPSAAANRYICIAGVDLGVVCK